jgi:hypothetical protein
MIDRASGLSLNYSKREGFDHQSPPVTACEREALYKVRGRQRFEIEPCLLSLAERELNHLIHILLFGEIDRPEMNSC